MTDNANLIREIQSVNRTLDSELLRRVVGALHEHPVTVTEAELEEARKAGALGVLRDMVSYGPVRQAGHPEEETREFDNIDVRNIADRARVSTREVWARMTDAERAELEKIRPMNWDDMGSSARDLWEDRQLRSMRKAKAIR